MDTTGGRPKLDRQWAETDNNVYGVLHGCRDASAVAARFAGAGWRARSSSWHAYELETTWCLLEIDPVDGPDVLLSGVVDPVRLDDLGRLLGSMGFTCELELSHENDTLVREIRG
ncbi:hypothetical protein [Streptomyces sp. NPDC053755]|uniref:hypothetical protein n=1 Tax=Streptomyces sp. NPDC053755 TaxID=3155815 RepID=UPI00343F2A88